MGTTLPKLSGPLLSECLVQVVDDDESIRRSLSRLFRSAHLLAEVYDSAQAFLEQAKPHAGPQCLVLDVQLPGTDGLDLQRTIAKRGIQIIFLTAYGDIPKCAEALKAGAVDFLTKPVDDITLLEAVSRALHRSAELRSAKAQKASMEARFNLLTPREFEVMQGIIAGLLNKQIGAELGVAEKTVKIHRGRVMKKTGVASVADLVRLAQATGVRPSLSPTFDGSSQPLLSHHDALV